MMVAVHPGSATLPLQVMKSIVRIDLYFSSKDGHLCLVCGVEICANTITGRNLVCKICLEKHN